MPKVVSLFFDATSQVSPSGQLQVLAKPTKYMMTTPTDTDKEQVSY